jgi:hypothetical protein
MGRWVLALVLVSSARLLSGATVVVNDTSGAYHDPGCGTSGTGLCSIVDAIAFANAHDGADTIHFNLPGAGVVDVAPGGTFLPPLTDAAGVAIDGFSQPGAAANTLNLGSNAIWRIRVFGGTMGFGITAFDLPSSNNVIQGMILEGWFDGVGISGSDNRVSGNFIGGGVSGGFGNGNGVRLHDGAKRNLVGGLTPQDRNVISGNGYGIFVEDAGTSDNVIQGNFIGLTQAADGPHYNFRGILVWEGATDNRIGGSVPGARNVIGGSSTNGIELIGPSSGTRIEGNFIGTPDGATALWNQAGVYIQGSANNVVGGAAPGSGNVLSGNGWGVTIEGIGAEGNRVVGNRIGTNVDGTAALPNEGGVGIGFHARNNVVGGPTSGERNVISGNVSEGVLLGGVCTENSVIGNFIGTDASGSLPIGNGISAFGEGAGVLIADRAFRNRIGGGAPGEGNVIAYNGGLDISGAGIRILPGGAGGDSFGNTILSNSIHSNTGLGLDLENLGTAPNDPGDKDGGANARQNYPVIAAVSQSGGVTRVQGTLDSSSMTSFTLQFFSNSQCDNRGSGEGQNFLGSATVLTDLAGHVDFDVLLPSLVPDGYRVTATATDSDGNTSEFSACFPQASSFYTMTPCRVVDTRDPAGEVGGPALSAGTERSFPIAGRCGVPPGAQAVALNVTVTQPTSLGNLRLFPLGSVRPLTSILNYQSGQTRANNVIGSLGNGRVVVRCDQFNGSAHVVIDVNGYFQ